VREVDARATYRPLDRGISVERWYETVDTRRPVTSVVEGQVVRVRLRVTIADDRNMVVLDDPLPAGLEAVDLSLRTVSPFAGDLLSPEPDHTDDDSPHGWWGYGSWDSGMWSAFDHTEIRDDRVVYFARRLWRGSYNATYLARATTAGRFVSGPAHAEEMYNPGVHGRSGGGVFTVRPAGR
jgi:alpha-2-macroglobulin